MYNASSNDARSYSKCETFYSVTHIKNKASYPKTHSKNKTSYPGTHCKDNASHTRTHSKCEASCAYRTRVISIHYCNSRQNFSYFKIYIFKSIVKIIYIRGFKENIKRFKYIGIFSGCNLWNEHQAKGTYVIPLKWESESHLSVGFLHYAMLKSNI